MKKLLAILMAGVFVLGLSTVAFAGDEGFSYSGKFTLEWNANGFDAPSADDKNFIKGVFTVELKKTEGNVTAGVKASVDPMFKEGPDEDTATLAAPKDFYGYVTIDQLFDTFKLTAASSVDLGVGTIKGSDGLAGAPGLKVELVPDVVEGLSATFAVNDQNHAPSNTVADYGFGVSGAYKIEGVGEFGGAYAKDSTTGYAVWGSLAPVEGVTVKGEYNSKTATPNAYAYFVEGSLAELVEGLTVTTGYEGKNATWGHMDMDDDGVADEDTYTVHGYYRNTTGAESNVYAEGTFGPISELVTFKGGIGYTVTAKNYAAYVGADFTLGEGLTAGAAFNYRKAASTYVGDSADLWKITGNVTYVVDPATYKVSVTYKDTKAYEVKPEVSYNFGAGVTGNAFVSITDASTVGYGASLTVSF